MKKELLCLQIKTHHTFIQLTMYDYILMNISNKKTTKETLKSIQIAISNVKKITGNYHKIKRKYLQLYLNEFV